MAFRLVERPSSRNFARPVGGLSFRWHAAGAAAAWLEAGRLVGRLRQRGSVGHIICEPLMERRHLVPPRAQRRGLEGR